MQENKAVRVLVLGATGMLGSSIFRYFSNIDDFETYGTIRTESFRETLERRCNANAVRVLNATEFVNLSLALKDIQPDIVFNCIGIIKQKQSARNYTDVIEINSLLPHKIAAVCSEIGAKLIHFSTDCVFDGKHGNYCEESFPNAVDLYGRSKHMGEVTYDGHLTIRTSIIGHELGSQHNLVDWFLSQSGKVCGYSQAIFSGLPTISVAKFCRIYTISGDLHGLYHLSSEPIDKYSLLKLIALRYGHEICVNRSASVIIDRSLASTKLHAKTGYIAVSWPELIEEMFDEYTKFHD